ncbi:MAG TPA: DUF6116 family protein [Dokdonella sp.]
MPNPITSPLLRWAGNLRFPRLALLTAALFVADLLIPDMIPLVDEILLGLGTLLLTQLRHRKRPAARQEQR